MNRTLLLLFAFGLSAGCGPLDPDELLRLPSGKSVSRVDGYELEAVLHREAIHFQFRPEDPSDSRGRVEFVLTPRDESVPAWTRTRAFNVAWKGPTVNGAPPPELALLADTVLGAVRQNEGSGTWLRKRSRYAESPDWSTPRAAWLARTSGLAGIALVGLFLLTAPFAAWIILREISSSLGRRGLLLLLVIVLGGLLLRVLLPHRPVMHYMGYRMTQLAAVLDEIPKYGPGSLALHHLLFQLTGPSHRAVMMLNAFLGGLAPLAGAALLARLGADRVATILGGAFMALVPLLIKDSTSESLGVPMLFWTLSGLVLLLRARVHMDALSLLLGVLHLALAVMSRPEAVLLVPLAALLLTALTPSRGPSLSHAGKNRAFLVAMLASAAFVLLLGILRIAQGTVAVEAELARGNTPDMLTLDGLRSTIRGLVFRNAAFWPSLFPTIVSVMALGAPLALAGHSRPRRESVVCGVLVGIALAWIAVSQLDLPYVSIPRVQAPGLAFLVLAAAWGASALIGLPAFARMTRTIRSLIIGIAIVSIVVSAAATVPVLWARNAADEEESLLRDAYQSLPDEPVTLVRRSYRDPPREPIHLYWPDYFSHPPFRDDRVMDIASFLEDPPMDRQVFFLMGVRCHLRACDQSGIHPGCAEISSRFRLEPVVERDVPIHRLPIDRQTTEPLRDMDFGWCYGSEGPLRIGLYRVLPLRE